MAINLKMIYSLCVLQMSVLVCSAQLSSKQETDVTKYLSKQIESCDVRDVTSLNQCLKDITNNLKPYFPYGVKAWKIPTMEPMHINLIKIAQHNGGTSLTADFKDLLVSGLSDFSVTYVKSYPEKYTFDIGMRIPRLAIKGRYDIDGKVLVLALKDKGPFTANITDITAKADMKFRVTGGKLRLHTANADFKFRNIRFHLDDLFGGSPLGETVNESLNASVDDLLRDFKPAFLSEIDKIIKQAFEEALSHMPLSKWMKAFTK